MKNANNIQYKFGQQVKLLRKKTNMSQEAFADKCGLDRTYISGIERGVRNPTLQIINTIAKNLDVELSTLFDFDNK
ncbi:XRE family transcriptional regulator [Candidatus Schmidhempelia bombi str. Bimp]|jgi:transcriptional regulator with XRE-family HTH domain|uniref:XRE family transcriptional regulator n=2 Tax=Candidatus Schmidhempelia TaxID=1505768 RepID=A0AB94IAS8_9GAMM|nr:helix-turn-helix transcriptional regulator [Candidatus Schmidhempelia bombi]TEA26509.1 XRE family transcriptional regulator [Candidatus Schmidhempelia bombi str. Bimp]